MISSPHLICNEWNSILIFCTQRNFKSQCTSHCYSHPIIFPNHHSWNQISLHEKMSSSCRKQQPEFRNPDSVAVWSNFLASLSFLACTCKIAASTLKLTCSSSEDCNFLQVSNISSTCTSSWDTNNHWHPFFLIFFSTDSCVHKILSIIAFTWCDNNDKMINSLLNE